MALHIILQHYYTSKLTEDMTTEAVVPLPSAPGLHIPGPLCTRGYDRTLLLPLISLRPIPASTPVAQASLSPSIMGRCSQSTLKPASCASVSLLLRLTLILMLAQQSITHKRTGLVSTSNLLVNWENLVPDLCSSLLLYMYMLLRGGSEPSNLI